MLKLYCNDIRIFLRIPKGRAWRVFTFLPAECRIRGSGQDIYNIPGMEDKLKNIVKKPLGSEPGLGRARALARATTLAALAVPLWGILPNLIHPRLALGWWDPAKPG